MKNDFIFLGVRQKSFVINIKKRQMKNLNKITLIIIAILFLNYANAQDTIAIKSEIRKVTLYKSGANIKRNVNKLIHKGRQTIVLTGLSKNIDKNTIKVSAGKNATIISVSHRTNFLSKKSSPKKVKLLEKMQKSISDSIKYFETMLRILDNEKDMLQMNRSIAGNQNGINIENLKATYKFYKSKILEIEIKTLKFDTKILKYETEISEIENQLKEMNITKKEITSEIVVELSSKIKQTANINFEYFVYNAGWKPYYDIRVKNTNKPVKMIYNAKVYNNTGIDWKNVKFSISTGNPNQNALKPTLYPYILTQNGNLYRTISLDEVVVTAIGVKRNKKELGYSVTKVDVDKTKNENNRLVAVNMTETVINNKFDIEIPYTIMSNNKEYNVKMSEFELPTEYKHYTVPKLTEKVFLTARITNWQDFGIINGNANIFFKETYSGKTFFNTKITSDTLNISLGIDNDIIIKREAIKEFCKTNYIASSRKDDKRIKITVKNLKKYPVNLVVEDQFPISQFSNIKIKKIEKSGAKENEDTGELTWDFELKSLKSKEIIIDYSVKYPKNMSIKLE